MRKPQLQKYLKSLANEIGLADWTFEIQKGADEANMVEVSTTTRRAHAIIYFSKDFHRLRPEDMRYYISHELSHCLDSQLTDVITSGIEKLKEQAEEYGVNLEIRTLLESIDSAMEYRVDKLAKILAKRLPLP